MNAKRFMVTVGNEELRLRMPVAGLARKNRSETIYCLGIRVLVRRIITPGGRTPTADV